MKTRILPRNMSFAMFSVSLDSLVLFWKVKSYSFSNGVSVTHGNSVFENFCTVPFGRPFCTMSGGTANVLEGRNALTHNWTIHAIQCLSSTRAHMGVRRAQNLAFI